MQALDVNLEGGKRGLFLPQCTIVPPLIDQSIYLFMFNENDHTCILAVQNMSISVQSSVPSEQTGPNYSLNDYRMSLPVHVSFGGKTQQKLKCNFPDSNYNNKSYLCCNVGM